FVEIFAQYRDDEFHRRVIVVEQQYAIHAGLLGLRTGTGDDRRPRSVLTPAARLARGPGRTRSLGHRVGVSNGLVFRKGNETSDSHEIGPPAYCREIAKIRPVLISTNCSGRTGSGAPWDATHPSALI